MSDEELQILIAGLGLLAALLGAVWYVQCESECGGHRAGEDA